MQDLRKLSFSERLGSWGIIRVVWCSIPWRFRLFAFPYCWFVYRRFMANSTNVGDLKSMHINHCYESRVFRLFRPRFHIVRGVLLSREVKREDAA